MLDNESPTSANLGNDNGFGTRPFGEAQSKAMRAYAQSGQYHTIVESRVHLTSLRHDSDTILKITTFHNGMILFTLSINP